MTLSMEMRDLLLIRRETLEFGNRLGIEKLDTTKSCKMTVCEDNQGCFKLSHLDLGKMISRSKMCVVKYH